MDKKSIIQWNCRGLKASYNEILILMSLFSPSVICLQETFLEQSDDISLRDFNISITFVLMVRGHREGLLLWLNQASHIVSLT